MKFAYADPPYLGCAEKLYGDPTYDDPEAHRRLIQRLQDEFPDGWALSMHTPSLRILAPMMPADIRWASWVKPFASFKPGVNPGYCWEPVAFKYANLATLHDALAVLVGYKIITHDDRIRLTRKFMDDRPEFKEAVAKALGGTVVPPSTKGEK